MSRTVSVGVRLQVDHDLETLLTDIESAHRRALKSEPGERVEITGYEALCAALEAKAAAVLCRGGSDQVGSPDPDKRTAGVFTRSGADIVVSLTLPLEPGRLNQTSTELAAPEPASRVPIRGDLRGRRLVEARFREQLGAAITDPGQHRSSAMSPSGIHNRVLTEVLRHYVDRRSSQSVEVPVVYRDGSRAENDFPFGCLDLIDELRRAEEVDLSLRLTLLSIRHTEMDPVVDGAWLRNAEVSKSRQAAQTDDFVFRTSMNQLDALTDGGQRTVRLRIFQTGLETAIVGFFRAVTEFSIRYPGQLEVVPMFYLANAGQSNLTDESASFEAGQTWATRA